MADIKNPSYYVFKVASGNYNSDWERFIDLQSLEVNPIGTLKKDNSPIYGVDLKNANLTEFFKKATTISEKGVIFKKGHSINSIDWKIDIDELVKKENDLEGFPPFYIEIVLFDI